MDRKERRRRARERKKLEEKLKKEAIRSETKRQESTTRLGRGLSALKNTFTGAKALLSLVLVLLALLGGWAVLRPHISVEPYIPLNPVDPYSTQFIVKNENVIFDAHDINCVCWPRTMQSGNGFSVISPTPLPNMHHQIKVLPPGATST